MQKYLILTSLALILSIQISKPQSINRVEPVNWWVGMKNQNLQLMIYGKSIGDADVKIDYAGVKLVKINRVSNQNYLFLDLFIDEKAQAGNFDINFIFKNRNILKYSYSLFQRKKNSSLRNGFSSKDVVYLIMPDRFANGDTLNDNAVGFTDSLDRENQYGRHGGDIQGIINHLNYFNDLGVTTLWLTPVLENNQVKGSYHGYSITDYYNIDPRHGSNELYKSMVEKAHSKRLKIIMDMVFNHCGSEHWWINDLPSEDWINVWPEYTSSNFRAVSLSDPYASDYDVKKMSKGWFVTTMPDLNQENPFLANYLTQNSIWWVEFADLDGIRMDTYPFSEKNFMAHWANAIMTEYPNFNIVAEAWFRESSGCAYWQKDANNRDGYNSNVPSVMDFPLMFTMQVAFDDTTGWDIGLIRLYNHLSKDLLYANPSNILIFADNHDESRFFRANDSINRYKMAMTFLLTTRGIPQIYYGTELLTMGLKSDGDGKLRPDFVGGWSGDNRNAFLPEGRTKKENESWIYLQTLLKWRKGSEVIQSGKLKHFVPEDNIYVYFRYNSSKAVMVILNSNKTEKILKTDRFREILVKYSKGVEVISNKRFDSLNEIELAPYSSAIIELIP